MSLDINYKKTLYPYRLLTDVSVPVADFPDCEHEYFNLRKGVLTMKEGYAIDGVTAWIDFPGLMPGAFVHDALLQAIGLELLPGSLRSKTHIHFYTNATKRTVPQKVSATLAYIGLLTLHDLWHKLSKS